MEASLRTCWTPSTTPRLFMCALLFWFACVKHALAAALTSGALKSRTRMMRESACLMDSQLWK